MSSTGQVEYFGQLPVQQAVDVGAAGLLFDLARARANSLRETGSVTSS